MKNRLSTATVFITLLTLFFASANAGTYDENYKIDKTDALEQNDNRFINGNFEAIYRFGMIVFDDKEMDEASQVIVQNAISKIREVQKSGKDFYITLLGHTQQTDDDKNEQNIESKSYAHLVQNWFTNNFESNESMHLSQEYIKLVEQKLINENIAKEKIFLEARGGEDQIYTEICEDEKKNSHGVFLTLYLVKKVEQVQQKSEAIMQKEPLKETKVEPKVNSDDSNSSLKTLPKETLKLNFEVGSDRILASSYGEIQRFSRFLKEHPAYGAQIVGHTDSRGKAVLNMDLSEKRALMTKRAIVDEGIDASRLRVKGKGELEPIASNLTLEGREANRRIEVELFLVK